MKSQIIMLNTYNRIRLLLLIGAISSFVLFFIIGGLVGLPYYRDFQISLMQQPGIHLPIGILAVAVGMILSVLLGSLIAGTVRFDAGLFVATLGLMAISIRGGTMQCVLQSATSPFIFLLLALELVNLYTFLFIGWYVQWTLQRRGWLKEDVFRDGIEDQGHPLWNRLMAAALQIVAMGLLVQFFAQSDAKMQVIASVGLASFLATLVAHSLFPIGPSIWFWVGPLVVGSVGYIAAYVDPQGLEVGQIQGILAPLARPLPLDYASVGTAGAILGYWMSRRWLREREDAKG